MSASTLPAGAVDPTAPASSSNTNLTWFGKSKGADITLYGTVPELTAQLKALDPEWKPTTSNTSGAGLSKRDFPADPINVRTKSRRFLFCLLYLLTLVLIKRDNSTVVPLHPGAGYPVKSQYTPPPPVAWKLVVPWVSNHTRVKYLHAASGFAIKLVPPHLSLLFHSDTYIQESYYNYIDLVTASEQVTRLCVVCSQSNESGNACGQAFVCGDCNTVIHGMDGCWSSGNPASPASPQ